MPREKPTRRKSLYQKKTSSLGPSPEHMEPDEVEKLYTDPRGNYKAPDESELETLFETKNDDATAADSGGEKRATRKCAATEELAIGKYKAKRKMEQMPFWIEDPAKTRHRQEMSKKIGEGVAAGGRKKKKGTKAANRFVALNEEQEIKLARLIEEKETTTEEEDILEHLDDNDEEEKENVAVAASLALSKRNSAVTPQRTSRVSFAPLLTTPDQSSSSAAKSKGARRKRTAGSRSNSEGGGVLTKRTTRSLASRSRSPSPSTSRSSNFGLCTPGNPVVDEDFTMVKTPASESERVRELVALEAAKMSQEELQRQIEEADSLFGVVAADTDDDDEDEEEAKRIKKQEKKRQSVSVSVRRSSRFLGRTDTFGSVCAVAEVSESKLNRGKKNRRSNGYGLVIPQTAFKLKGLYEDVESQENAAEKAAAAE
jgi:hypothetical protein